MSPPNEKGVAPGQEATPETATAKQDYLIPLQLSGQVYRGMISRPQLSATKREFWVLTRIIDDSSDPDWGERLTIYGSPERIHSMFDLSQGVPAGWELLKGTDARQFMLNMIRDEIRWRQERRGQSKL
jgi:hypothetical protein